MTDAQELNPALAADLQAKGVDIRRTLKIIAMLEEAESGTGPKGRPESFALPRAEGGADGRITDLESFSGLSIPRREAEERLEDLGMGDFLKAHGERRGADCFFGPQALRRLGVLLYPKVAYGVLNGGSATSYADVKKNRSLSPAAFDALRDDFEGLSERIAACPKGITPAYLEADGSEGPSFLLLKMRSLLIQALEYRLTTGDRETPVLPFFQMTSAGTDGPLAAAYARYREDPLLADLIRRTGVDPTRPLSEVQGLLAALTPASEGLPRRIFDRAYGAENRALPLPGGHGENFRVLAPVYRELLARGVRYAYLGNVDNSGYTVDPAAVAVAALSGAQGAFEFSWRTAVDVKGGILAENGRGRLTVAELGQALDYSVLERHEAEGGRVLFNCATGLFDLRYLTEHLEEVVDGLPIRVSEQDKDAGRYAQAEQTTWEILGLLSKPAVLGVSKERRFIAAKLLMETLLAGPSGLRAAEAEGIPRELAETSARLRRGLGNLLEGTYGFSAPDASGKRRPLSLKELSER